MQKETLLEKKCYECGKTMVGKRENYPYQEAGLRSVVLLNILVYHCRCGAIVPEIPYAGVLHHCIAMSVLKKKALLSGEEIRFVRKLAGYSGTELARVMGVEKGTVSKWENEKKKIGKETDRLLRLTCFAKVVERLVGIENQAKGDDLVTRLKRLGRMVESLNLTTVLENIEDRREGSKPVRIDPDTLAAMDSTSQLVNTESRVQ
jgi:putative zinc finger/helix-turn-helix YgiT family protein